MEVALSVRGAVFSSPGGLVLFASTFASAAVVQRCSVHASSVAKRLIFMRWCAKTKTRQQCVVSPLAASLVRASPVRVATCVLRAFWPNDNARFPLHPTVEPNREKLVPNREKRNNTEKNNTQLEDGRTLRDRSLRGSAFVPNPPWPIVA